MASVFSALLACVGEISFILPKSGIASLVVGIVSATTCEKTVNDRSIVTPETQFVISNR